MRTPAHIALSIQQFLTKNSMTPVPHPPYSPNHSSSEFFAFIFVPLMKTILKEKCFTDVEEVKQKKAEALKGIKFFEFKNCFEQWEKVLIGVLHQIESEI